MPTPSVQPDAPSAAPITPVAWSETDALIDNRYVVHSDQPLPGAGGGQPAFAVTDRMQARQTLMAVRVDAATPARASGLTVQRQGGEPGVLLPLAWGAAPVNQGQSALHVVCPAPPGPPLWATMGAGAAPWPEAELIRCVLRPVAQTLMRLQSRRLTHRAIRPTNLFLTEERQAVLGCAWAAPPAMHQPAAWEPPYVAMCDPSARGEGDVADDVYALGVTLLALALGRRPLAGQDDDTVILRKLDFGCCKALTAGTRLASQLGDLLVGMLADDPAHRPSLELLLDSTAVRGRRVATRPASRAAQTLQIEGLSVWNARALAFAMARHPAAAANLLRLGVVDHWLRRALNDSALALRVEESVRPHGSSAAVMKAVAVLDPLAPLCWDGLALWPAGIGPLLARGVAAPDTASKLSDLLAQDAIPTWLALREGAAEAALARLESRAWRAVAQDMETGGPARLRYQLNPLLPCASPALAGQTVTGFAELPPALERSAAGGRLAEQAPDRELVGFIAARRPGGWPVAEPAPGEAGPHRPALRLLGVLAQVQAELPLPLPLPAIAAWLGQRAAPALEGWHSKRRREAKQRELPAVAATGDLRRLLALFDTRAERQLDKAGFRAAQAQVADIDARLAALDTGASLRAATARALGREIATALSLAGLAATAIAAGLGG